MALSEERLAGLLAYCKLTELADDPEVQTLIPAFYDSAVEYLADAGIQEPAEGAARARYDLCVNYLVLAAFDQRDAAVVGSNVVDNPIVRRMLNQLKLSQPANPQTLADLEVT